MSSLILKMSVSLDGYVADAGGDNSFIFPSMSEDGRAWTLDAISRATAHLMGAKTYRDMASHWPQSDSPIAAPMNDIPKVVFSKSLAEAPWGETRILSGDLADEVAALKNDGDDGYLLAHGGSRLAQSLTATGLVDEYQLAIHPVALGEGMPLFASRVGLELVSVTAFAGGAVAQVYRPAVSGRSAASASGSSPST